MTCTEEDLEEVRNGVDPTPNLGSARRGHGRGRGPEDRLEEQGEDEDLGMDAAIDDDEAGAEMEVEPVPEEPAVEVEEEGGNRTVSVDDFLAALESALEDIMGDEVEVTEEPPADEEEVEAEVEIEPGGEVEVGAEEELMETGAGDTGASAGDESETHPGDEDYKKKVDEANVNESEDNDDLVEAVTKRVAARILKAALNK